jgi:hypothetical protein
MSSERQQPDFVSRIQSGIIGDEALFPLERLSLVIALTGKEAAP